MSVEPKRGTAVWGLLGSPGPAWGPGVALLAGAAGSWARLVEIKLRW